VTSLSEVRFHSARCPRELRHIFVVIAEEILLISVLVGRAVYTGQEKLPRYFLRIIDFFDF